MKATVRYSLVPLLGIAGCLFVLTTVAPWFWSESRPTGEMPDDWAGVPADAPEAPQPPPATEPPVETTLLVAQPQLPPRSGDAASWSPMASQLVAKRVATTAPPVADKIQLDPSIAETPSLPVPDQPAAPVLGIRQPATAQSPDPDSDLDALTWSVRTPVLPTPHRRWHWPVSDALIEQVRQLERDPMTADWARDARRALESLQAASPNDSAALSASLRQLHFLCERAERLAVAVRPLNHRAQLLRARYALHRRVDVWDDVFQVFHGETRLASVRPANPQNLQAALQRVAERLSGSEHGETWQRYLRLHELQAIAGGRIPIDQESRSQLARTTLSRMDSPMLTPEQQAFFQGREFQTLAEELRYWVAEPVNYREMLDQLEQFELTASSVEARAVADAYQILRWSTSEDVTRLAEELNMHYRNANLRVAVSDELINRMLPDPPTMEEMVNDTLLGARVFGRSRTSTRLKVFFMPDRLRWRMGLEANGVVASETETSRGPATFYHEGLARYQARKLLQVDRRGVRASETEAAADTAADLTGMETDFDSLPVFNMLARAIARQQHDSQSASAADEIRGRVAGRVRQRLDEEVEQELARIQEQFKSRFYDPMQQLQLNPMPVDMETTDTRLIVRYRLAGDRQLAAHTPRPQAPGDSLLSFQLHESAINNVIDQLKLDGRTVELRELYREIGRVFENKDVPLPDDIPVGVSLTFAQRDAIRIRCEDGRIEISLALEELSHERETWNEFVVRATYTPLVVKLDPTLERDGYVRLNGRRLNLRDQIALRGIFSAVFPRNPPVHFLGEQIGRDERFQDLQVTQLAIRDGWIGLALGKQSAENVGRLPGSPSAPARR